MNSFDNITCKKCRATLVPREINPSVVSRAISCVSTDCTSTSPVKSVNFAVPSSGAPDAADNSPTNYVKAKFLLCPKCGTEYTIFVE